jgi:hypothetical protein
VTRLRALAERPLDPAVGRVGALLAGAVSVGFATVVVLGLLGPGGGTAPRPEGRPRVAAVSAAETPAPAAPVDHGTTPVSHRPAQDPQDRPGTPSARRAHHELAAHLALQHLPWRRGALTIRLIGASGPKAILVVDARSLTAARRGYRSFLRAFDDDGLAYRPLFRARGGRRG